MKHTLAITVGVVAIVGVVYTPAFAQRPSPLPVRSEVQERVQDRQEDQEERREQLRDRLTVQHRERIRAWWGRTMQRLEAIVPRLERIASLVQDRIDRLTDADYDTAEAQAQLDEARARITDVETAITELTATIERLIESEETPTEIFREIRGEVNEVVEQTRVAHRALIRVLSTLRQLVATPTPDLSPTASASE